MLPTLYIQKISHFVIKTAHNMLKIDFQHNTINISDKQLPQNVGISKAGHSKMLVFNEKRYRPTIWTKTNPFL